MTVKRPLNVLFLCTHNSARSVLAESIMNRLGEGKFKGYSAGSMPSGRINPLAIDLLKSLNYDTSQLRSKSWDEFAGPDAPVFDFIFTVCDNAASEVCPIWPGHPMTAHWGIEDPSAAQGTEAERRLAFAEAYRMLSQRIGAFVNLPLESLDALATQRRLKEIGAMEGSTSVAKV